MHDDVRETFREAIMRTGATLQQHVGHFTEPVLVWRKQPDKGQWLGETQQRPSLSSIFATARQQINEISADFLRAFLLHHPEYAGMMGFSGLGRLNLLHLPGFILGQTMSTLWTRHGTFQPESGAVEALIQEFSEFIDQPHVRFRFTAPLLNYQMDIDHVPLPEGLAIRRLGEQEVSAIHGGPIVRPGFTPRGIRVHHECAIEGEFEEPKVFGMRMMVRTCLVACANDSTRRYWRSGRLRRGESVTTRSGSSAWASVPSHCNRWSTATCMSRSGVMPLWLRIWNHCGSTRR